MMRSHTLTLQAISWLSLIYCCLGADLPDLTNEEIVQTATSRRLVELSNEMKENRRTKLEATIQDIQRAVKLDEPRTRLLRIAAEGAMEQRLGEVRGSMQETVEGRTKAAEARDAAAVAASTCSSYSINSPMVAPLWKAALNQILRPEEKTAWDALVKDRAAYYQQAVAEILANDVERKLRLTSEQLNQFQPLIHKAVADYLPDLKGLFSSDDEESIYTQYLSLLIRGIEDKAAKSIITDPTQWRDWEAFTGEAGSQWDWLKRKHAARLQQEKAGL